MTSLDEEIIVDVDLDKDVPCDNKGCEAASAEWLLIRDCCGFQELKCTEHKELALKFISVMNRQYTLVTCDICKTSSYTHHYVYVGRI